MSEKPMSSAMITTMFGRGAAASAAWDALAAVTARRAIVNGRVHHRAGCWVRAIRASCPCGTVHAKVETFRCDEWSAPARPASLQRPGFPSALKLPVPGPVLVILGRVSHCDAGRGGYNALRFATK